MGESPTFRLSEWSIRLSDRHRKVNEGNAYATALKSAVASRPYVFNSLPLPFTVSERLAISAGIIWSFVRGSL
jgi:hypothetical protein